MSYRIDAASGWAEIQQPGEYRVAVTRNSRDSQTNRDPQASEVELVVLRGAADLMNEDGQTTLRAGERAFARAGTAPSYAVRLQLGRLGCFRPVVGGPASGTERRFRPVPARDGSTLLLDVRSLRLLAARRVLRVRVVSDGERRLASLLLRPVGELSLVRVDVDWLGRRGPGRRITMGVGAFQPACGSGSPGEPGVRRGCPGRTRRAT